MKKFLSIGLLYLVIGCAACPKNSSSIQQGRNYSKCDFSNINMDDANFSNCNLSHAIFRNTELSRANFNNANISHADFSNANLTNANLLGAWGGTKSANSNYESISFITEHTNLSRVIWLNGRVCSNDSITVCKY